ncbi:MAG: hypothetical protein LC687_00005 [Actinobacteria bacterium]|nr:hypothetical protein [Actinomycetota bacterium]
MTLQITLRLEARLESRLRLCRRLEARLIEQLYELTIASAIILQASCQGSSEVILVTKIALEKDQSSLDFRGNAWQNCIIDKGARGPPAIRTEGVTDMATILSPTDLATEFETDARTVRKFLRSVTPKDAQPGKGHRWGIEKRQLRSLRKQYTSWAASLATATEEPTEAEEVTAE